MSREFEIMNELGTSGIPFIFIINSDQTEAVVVRFYEVTQEKRDNHDDVIIVKHNLVTDSSYSNIIFLKEGRWY